MAKKRGNNEGSIYRRENGTWAAQYTVWTAEGRKRRSVSGKTRAEVARKLTEAMANRDGGLVYDAGKLTVGEYLDRWFADSVKDTVRQRTYERYESITRVHIKPAIGRLKLKALTPAHARALYRQKLDSGLSPRTVNLHPRNVAKSAVSGCARWPGTAQRCSGKGTEAREAGDQTPLTGSGPETHQDRLRDRSRYAALYVVALHTGLREGEMLGLRWDDLDLDATTSTLQVRRTLSATRPGHKFELPKSGKGRSIKLSKKAVEALRSHRATQAEEKLRIGSL